MDDILDAAQTSQTTPTEPPQAADAPSVSPPPEPSLIVPPVDSSVPAPESSVSPEPVSSVSSDAALSESDAPSPAEALAKEGPPPEPVPEMPVSTEPPKKAGGFSGAKRNMKVLLAGLVLLIVTLPLIFFAVRQQAEIRGRAACPYGQGYCAGCINACRLVTQKTCSTWIAEECGGGSSGGTTKKDNGSSCSSGSECQSGYCDGPSGTCKPTGGTSSGAGGGCGSRPASDACPGGTWLCGTGGKWQCNTGGSGGSKDQPPPMASPAPGGGGTGGGTGGGSSSGNNCEQKGGKCQNISGNIGGVCNSGQFVNNGLGCGSGLTCCKPQAGSSNTCTGTRPTCTTGEPTCSNGGWTCPVSQCSGAKPSTCPTTANCTNTPTGYKWTCPVAGDQGSASCPGLRPNCVSGEPTCQNGGWVCPSSGGSCAAGAPYYCSCDKKCHSQSELNPYPNGCTELCAAGAGGGQTPADPPPGAAPGSGTTSDTGSQASCESYGGSYCEKRCHFIAGPDCGLAEGPASCDTKAGRCEQIDCFSSSGQYVQVMSIGDCSDGEKPPGDGGGGGKRQCVDIKILKDGKALTNKQIKALQPGNTVILALKTAGKTTKARFKVNNTDWEETTTKNADKEFTLEWTVPANTKKFTIEGERFNGKKWE